MVLLRSFLTALSTYSAIPVPRFAWTERSTVWALCFFPAVGLVCGGVLWGWYALCRTLDAGGVLFAAVAACLPLLITGGIHMDGYMDAVDAISSHQSREKKLEILKDPHCGAFAVIYCGIYMMLDFGLLCELYRAELLPVICPGFVLSRALSALCAVTMPNARNGGMLFSFTEHARKRGTVISAVIVAALAGAGMVLISPMPGLCAVTLALLSVPCYRSLARRQFGGVTGDTAGFFLQICELAVPIGAWIGGAFLR